MFKKLLALLLAALLCLSAVACTTETPSTEGSETESDSESASESTSESTTETESESETETDKSDLPEDESELLPAYEGANTLIDFTDTYNDCILMTVQGATKADYEAYIAKFSSFSNYEEIVAPRKVLGKTENLSSIYTKQTKDNGTYLINVLWIPEENSIYGVGEMKATIEPLRDTDLSVFDPASATTGEHEPLLIQIGLDELGPIGSVIPGLPDQVTESGMAYAYRLSDGSFIVLDGGGTGLGSTKHDKECAIRIYETMKAYSVTDEIVIAAWIFSHPHVDHMGGFMSFTQNFLNNPNYDVTLERVISYMPNVEAQSYVDAGKDYSLSPEKVETYNARLEQLREQGVSIYKGHAGQKYYVGNATVEILFTYDLITPTLPDAFFVTDAYAHMQQHGVVQNTMGSDFTNSYSMIWQITVNVDEDTSYKAIWTGDATCFGIETCNAMYRTAMKSDFVQVPHHGGTQFAAGSESDDYVKYYHQIQTNLFYGKVYGVDEKHYPLSVFAKDYNEDGSYGYVIAKYVLLPRTLNADGKGMLDGEPNDHPDNDSRLTTWSPNYHLQEEAQAQGGDMYISGCILTVFTLGDTVTVTEDRSVIHENMPEVLISGTVSSLEELQNMNPDGTYVLTTDLVVVDPTGALFPATFSGILDGNGHTITIRYISRKTTTFNAGSGFLFADLDGATIKNLTLTGVNMTVGSTSNQYGVLARRATGKVVINNVHLVGVTITDQTAPNANVGGFFGDTDANAEITIKNSSFDGTINSTHTVGGFIGRVGTSSAASKSVLIENCKVSGSINATGANVGALVGSINLTGPYSFIDCDVQDLQGPSELFGTVIAAGPKG